MHTSPGPHPYVPVSLSPILWLQDTATCQAPAVLTTGNRPAYRLTPAVYAAIHAEVDRLEQKWAADRDGLTGARREALGQAVRMLTELWDWLRSQVGTGTVATEPRRLPDIFGLIREVGQVERAETWEGLIVGDSDVGARRDAQPPVPKAPAGQKQRPRSRSASKKARAGDAIAAMGGYGGHGGDGGAEGGLFG